MRTGCPSGRGTAAMDTRNPTPATQTGGSASRRWALRWARILRGGRPLCQAHASGVVTGTQTPCVFTRRVLACPVLGLPQAGAE